MASLPVVNDAAYPTVSDVRDAYLRTIKYACDRRGIVRNVLPGSIDYIKADALAKRFAPAISNGRIGLDDVSPLKATGTKLVEVAAVWGVTPRAASSSAGYVEIDTTGTVTIPSGYQATSAAGKKYQTTTTSVGVADEALIELRSVDTGAATELDPGEILTWDSASVGGLKSTVVVGSGGIDGGTDADDDDRLRERLLDRLAFPAEAGNWAHVKALAEEASSSVEAAYIYPADRGPGSIGVALTKEGGDRTLSTSIVSSVSSYLAGNLPGFISLNVTSVTKREVDIILNAKLPMPVSAGGAGGGWRSSPVYPSNLDTTPAKVTATTPAARQITVDSPSADQPFAGENIAFWDPVTETLLEYTIVTVTGSSGAYVLTLDSSIASITTGMYVSAAAVNLESYCKKFLAAMQELGPGEKAQSTDFLPRAFRKPNPEVSNPADLSNRLLDSITNAHTEVLDIEYEARYLTGTSTSVVGVGVMPTAAEPPRVFVLKHFALRRKV